MRKIYLEAKLNFYTPIISFIGNLHSVGQSAIFCPAYFLNPRQRLFTQIAISKKKQLG